MSAAKIAYNLKEAAEATGYSIDVIRRAVRSGDLATVTPKIEGRDLARPVVTEAELRRWVEGRVA